MTRCDKHPGRRPSSHSNRIDLIVTGAPRSRSATLSTTWTRAVPGSSPARFATRKDRPISASSVPERSWAISPCSASTWVSRFRDGLGSHDADCLTERAHATTNRDGRSQIFLPQIFLPAKDFFWPESRGTICEGCRLAVSGQRRRAAGGRSTKGPAAGPVAAKSMDAHAGGGLAELSWSSPRWEID